MKKLMLFAWISVFTAFAISGVFAALPFKLQQNYFTGLSSPVFLTNAADGSRRIFIVQQRGIIKVAQPGSSAVSDYLNISTVVSSSGNERGLLGLAFHPQFETNRRFFVYYTRQSDGAVQIAEYEQSVANPNIANPTVVRTIITIPHAANNNHNGGTIAFGPDGFLYAAPGDGGGGNDGPGNAQNINVLLGKMLRIDINTPVGQNPAYNIPPTNPYAGATAGADEIYAIGLRNPYRFSFDRSGTSQLWVGDVGQDAAEEVDIVTLGGNYGWRVYEGAACTGLNPANCTGGGNPIVHIPPVFEYSSLPNVSRCAVTGGYVYRGKQNALPLGSYVYADYCTGEILLWSNNQQTLQLDTSRLISSFGEDEDGEIYVVGLAGTVDRIIGNRTTSDFDGDGGTDYSVYRPNTGVWYSTSPLNNSSQNGFFGLSTDIPVSQDFDGDTKTDFAVFRPSEGVWYYIRSGSSTVGAVKWGLAGDVPTPGDFDGDRSADLVVFRPSSGQWYIRQSSNSFEFVPSFGIAEDVPVNSDYDGDGLDDLAVWRPSTGVWWRVNSSDGILSTGQFGISTDLPAPGDFDGDGKTDLGIYRPSSGVWYIARSSDSTFQIVQFGLPEDKPVVGDFDRDYRDDIAVWRPSAGTWWVLQSSTSSFTVAQFGLTGDVPIASSDRP